jgi:hypothetical protein
MMHGDIFSGPTRCYDVRHRLATHVTKSLVTRTLITWIEKREHTGKQDTQYSFISGGENYC